MKTKFYLIVVAGAFILGLTAFMKSEKSAEISSFDEKEPRNLQVLPNDISNEDLKETMKFFSKSLNVKCSFCHNPKKDDPKSLDFANDENYYKQIARRMVLMTNDINERHAAPFETPEGELIVPNHINCMTCHNGQRKPATTEVNISDVKYHQENPVQEEDTEKE